MEVIIPKGQTEDIVDIAGFQVDMAMESDGTLLDKDTVTNGVTAAMNDENKGSYYVDRVDGRVVGSLMLTQERIKI